MNEHGHRESSAGTAIAITLVLVFLLIGGLLVASGFAVFVFRSAAQREAMVARERLMVAVEQAERAKLLASRQPAQVAATGDAGRRIDVKLDAEGQIGLDGSPVPLPELAGRISAAVDARPIAVHLEVDPQCQFRHLDEVMRICRQNGVNDIRFAGQTDAAPRNDTVTGQPNDGPAQ